MAHILIVDDEESIQRLTRTILESAGHSIFEAHDGQAALDILETYPKPFDVILLDVRMPIMDGFEFLSILQKQPFRPPVIVLSAASDQIPHELAGMISGHLLKPFTRQELNDAVENLLGVSPTFT